MPSPRASVAATAALALGVALAGAARADVAARTREDVARAEARFHAGEQLFDDKQYEAACAAFEESERLDPQLGTLLNLAFCQERLGKTATAWRAYGLAAVWAEERAQHDRAAWALGRAVEVSRRVPLVLLTVPSTANGYTIELDGIPVAPTSWGTPLAVDPGDHVVLVTARGHRGRQLGLRVPEGPVALDLTIPPLDVGTEMVLGPALAPAPREGPHRSSGRLVLGLAGIGVGVVAAGVGSYFGMRTFQKKNDAAGHCAGIECDATGVSLEEDAHRSATASTVAFVVGGASVAL
ncbi:MAG TPA: hypothetical protein VHS09_12300, partial [Polyangiaceae bacterium]|nr:hypothetical protein [Polyangiaceae bacterium]